MPVIEDAKIIKEGDLPGQIETSGVDTGEAGRYYTRMQYKERQFLRAKDFIAEQNYHIEKMRDHNKSLHTYGVCESEEGGVEGLQVKGSSGINFIKCVEVSKGMAIDRLGNSILLTQTEILDLSSSCVTGNRYVTPVYLYISYGVANASDAEFNLDEGGFAGCTRMVEKPKFKVSPTNDAIMDIRYLLLASIERDPATGKIGACDNEPQGRETAGIKLSMVGSADLTNGAVQSRHLAPGAAIGNIADNSLNGSKIVEGSVTAQKLATNAAINNIADNSLNGSKIAVGSIPAAKLATDAAIGNIRDGTLSAAKLANNAAANNINTGATTISGSKISDNSIKVEKLNYIYQDSGWFTIAPPDPKNVIFGSGTCNFDITPDLINKPYFLSVFTDSVDLYNFPVDSYTSYWYERLSKLYPSGNYNKTIYIENKSTFILKVRVQFFIIL